LTDQGDLTRMPPKERSSHSWVIYVDLDAFYVSCEIRDRPDLAGRRVIVGPDPKLGPSRGVVLSASYEARSTGVHSAMPVAAADRLCPDAVWVAPDFEKYERVSREVRSLLARRFEKVVGLSIDEAAIPVELPGAAEAEQAARALQASISEELHLPCSIGVAPSRTVAKIATDRAKPGGILVVPPEGVSEFLAPLSVRAVPGIGPKTEALLTEVGVTRIGELRSLPPGVRKRLGRFASDLSRLARGESIPSDEEEERGPRSRSTDLTFDRDTGEELELLGAVDHLSDELARSLARERLRYGTVSVALRWGDFDRTQKSRTLPSHQEGPEALRALARRLFDELWESERQGRRRLVRTVSVGVEKLLPARDRQVRLDRY
jgi:nucleotidyltransferase/DNA polymerase involved in DNA repair